MGCRRRFHAATAEHVRRARPRPEADALLRNGDGPPVAGVPLRGGETSPAASRMPWKSPRLPPRVSWDRLRCPENGTATWPRIPLGESGARSGTGCTTNARRVRRSGSRRGSPRSHVLARRLGKQSRSLGAVGRHCLRAAVDSWTISVAGIRSRAKEACTQGIVELDSPADVAGAGPEITTRDVLGRTSVSQCSPSSVGSESVVELRAGVHRLNDPATGDPGRGGGGGENGRSGGAIGSEWSFARQGGRGMDPEFDRDGLIEELDLIETMNRSLSTEDLLDRSAQWWPARRRSDRRSAPSSRSRGGHPLSPAHSSQCWKLDPLASSSERPLQRCRRNSWPPWPR
jgi:hypothetical protein